MEITHLPFLEVVKDITSKFNKIPNKDFVNQGKYAIIDQGANVIAGYTNDETVITDLGYPVIVFGDHTRVLKYVSYPFAIGADGVKVLSVDTEKAYPLYVFYFLKFLKIPNAGYSRHFKFLKEKKIALPKDIDDQKRIAKALSQCEALIQKRKESIDLLDDLLKSKFFDMFGDPRTNSKEWEIDSVITYADCIVPARDKPKSFTGSIPWVTTVDLLHLGKTIKSKQNIGLTEEEISQAGARVIPRDSVIMTCVGDLGVVSIAESNMVINQQLHAFQCKKKMNNIFLMYVLSFQKQYMYKVASKTTVPYMNKTNCNSIPVIKPPIDFQIEFATAYERTNKIKKQFVQSLQELENLYGSISQRAFNGELDLSKVDISNMDDSKKKDIDEVKDIDMEETTESIKLKSELLENVNEMKEDDAYLSKNGRLYIENSLVLRSKIYLLLKKEESINEVDFRDELMALNKIGKELIPEVGEYTAWQIDQHKFIERYISLFPQDILVDYPNINIFSRNQFDYSSMTLDDYYGIPDDVIEQYGSIEDKIVDIGFFFRKYFSDQSFTIQDVERVYNKVVYERGDWFKYEEMKEFIFKSLEGEDAFFTQTFEEVEIPDSKSEKSKRIKKVMLKVIS